LAFGVAIPKIGEFLHSKPSAFGLAMTAGVVGTAIGSVCMGMLADRFGRKWMLVLPGLIFGLATLVTKFISNIGQLILYRFIAGLGLGGALPIALAFGSEYAPSRFRKTFSAAMYAGVGTGGVIGGLFGAWFIPRFGWQSIFVLGGGLPVVIALLAAAGLPESLEFLTAKDQDKARIRKIVAKITPTSARDGQVEFFPTEKKLPGLPVKNLFTQGRTPMTILFWIGILACFWVAAVLVMWAPTFLHKTGATVAQYSLAFAAFSFGAVVATVLVGRMMDAGNAFRILPIGFVIGFLSLVAFGRFAGSSFLAAALLSVACGLFILGTQGGLIALVIVSYLADIRGTAVGWLYAIAKLGNIIASTVGGYFLAAGWSVFRICSTQAPLALFCAVIILIVERRVAAANRYRSSLKAERTLAGS
jgi:AAHS family 4-hydroxybenzoate transporter-like MFS transporter